VVARFHAQRRDSGIAVEAVIHNVFTVRDGKVVQVRGPLDRSRALEAIGPAESALPIIAVDPCLRVEPPSLPSRSAWE
jgi:hypothetical protein